jgi:CBS domain-containing protein
MKAQEIMKTEFIRVSKEDTVSGLIGKFVQTGQSTGFVFDGDTFLGITTMRHMLKTKMASHEIKVEKFVWHVPPVYKEDDLLDIATAMFHSASRALPVMEKDQLVGAVYAEDVIEHIKDIPELKEKKVKDIRHPEVHVVGEKDRIGKAFEIMFEQDIGRLPVVDEEGKLTGVLSFTDIAKKFLLHPAVREHAFSPEASIELKGTRGFKSELDKMLALPVKSFDTHLDIVTTSEDEKITVLADKMKKADVYNAVLTEDDKPFGIVTMRDLLEAMMSLKGEEIKNIRFTGLDELQDLAPYTVYYVKKLASYYAEKVAYLIKNINEVSVHFKEYAKEGKQHKYSVNVKVAAPTAIINSTKAVDWDIARTMHKAFKDVEKRIIHKFHTDTTRGKAYE